LFRVNATAGGGPDTRRIKMKKIGRENKEEWENVITIYKGVATEVNEGLLITMVSHGFTPDEARELITRAVENICI
jgi:Trp operon repressor